jgi:hypothetical protein
MRFAKARLILAVLALAAWVAYLAYQALAFGRFPVVSHAQLLVSTLDVIADVAADDQGRPEGKVLIVEVHWPPGRKDLAGQDLTVTNLPFARGWQGPGRYIMPLVTGEGGTYRVAAVPRSPGYEPFPPVVLIYPDAPLTRQQLDATPKPPVGEAAPVPGK